MRLASLCIVALLIGIAVYSPSYACDGVNIKADSRLLYAAAKQGHVDKAAAALDRCADADTKYLSGSTALHKAAQAGHTRIVELLLEAGADANAKSSVAGYPGHTAMHFAADQGHSEVVRALLKAKLEIDAVAAGHTALLRAARKGHTDVMRLLVKAGAAVNTKGPFNWSPLHIAAAVDNVEGIDMLLTAGAEVNALDSGCKTPLDYAQSNKAGKGVTQSLRGGGGFEISSCVKLMQHTFSKVTKANVSADCPLYRCLENFKLVRKSKLTKKACHPPRSRINNFPTRNPCGS